MLRKPLAKHPQAAQRHSPASKRVQAQLELRAKWIIREWERSPTYTYGSMITAVRQRFEIGQTMAEVAYARARELLNASVTEIDLGKIVIMYQRIVDEALCDKKYNAATRALNSLAVATGIVKNQRGAVVKVQHSGRIVHDHNAHVAALHFTPIERGHRERELLLKAGVTSEQLDRIEPDQLTTAISGALEAMGADDLDENGDLIERETVDDHADVIDVPTDVE